MTEEAVDAIVNAANVGLQMGGGVAGAIYRKGGEEIQEECNRLRYTPTGTAALTGAGKLLARFVIHAVGPQWHWYTPEENDRLLAAATVASLEIAREKWLTSIAFPAVSAGIFGFPRDRCAKVMLRAVAEWIKAHPTEPPQDIRFTLLPEEVAAIFAEEAKNLTATFAG
ncbi:MAG: macro domain-containing protein [Armatimonadaceae bacterium]